MLVVFFFFLSVFFSNTSYVVNCFLLFMTGFLPSAGIPLQKQLEHANQQSGFTDSVKTFDFWIHIILKNLLVMIGGPLHDLVVPVLDKCLPCYYMQNIL